MITKNFIISGLALGTMLIASPPTHAQIAPIDLGTLPTSGTKSVSKTIKGETTVFKFYHSGGELNLATVNVTKGKNLHISLYEDTDHDGAYNPSPNHDILLVGSLAGGQNNEDREIFAREKAGTYFAVVRSNNSSTANYAFIASTTGSKESNVTGASEVLDTLNSQFKHFPLDDKRTSDFYKFTLFPGQKVSITMTPTGGKAQMRLLQDAGLDHAITLASETLKSTPASSTGQTLTMNTPGNYDLQVSQSVPGQTVATDVKFQP